MSFEQISVPDARKLIDNENPVILDIRDPESYTEGHIAGATRTADLDMEGFLAETDKDTLLLVYCYHGFSSQQAAQFFEQHGFSRVHSMDGGFEAWSPSGN